MSDSRDNAIEWYTGNKNVTVSFTQKKFISKIKKYAEDHPDEIDVVAWNEDGSVCAHVPLSWIKISPPRKGREFTEEEKAAAAERLRNARNKK